MALQSLLGLVSRTFGIMPEKAFKMQCWIMVGRLMEKNFEEPGMFKWMAAGAAAGAATTIIGKLYDGQGYMHGVTVVVCRLSIRTGHGSGTHTETGFHSCH